MSHDTFWDAALAYACGANASAAFAPPYSLSDASFPNSSALHAVISSAEGMDPDTLRRMVHFTYALATVLPGSAKLTFPSVDETSLLRTLYPNRTALEPLLAVLDHLDALQESCDALPDGKFKLIHADGDILHITRTGPTEILDAIFNRGPHLYLANIDEKSTQVNPYGFTITVREHGHNANHSYYDFR